jgi:hypothetical protein
VARSRRRAACPGDGRPARDRRPRPAVGRRPRGRPGRPRKRPADAKLERRRPVGAKAVRVPAERPGRGDPARVQLHARDQRLLGAARPAHDRASRARTGGDRGLPRPRRLSRGRVEQRVAGCRVRAGPRTAAGRGAAGFRWSRSHDRPARHGGRPRAAVPARARAGRDRHRRRERERDGCGPAGRGDGGRAARDAARGDHRRSGRPGRPRRSRCRRVDSSHPRGGVAARRDRPMVRVLADRPGARGPGTGGRPER